MIHFISGKPRGGKSLYAVKLCVEELLHGSRTIITNLPFDLGRLNEYLQEKYPEKSIDLHSRIILLSDDDTGKFWTIRPHGVRIGCLTDADWRAGRKPDYSAVTDNGVFYAIDEIHNFFNSRAWMETGRDVLFYLSQHGKLGDTVLCITQHIGNVDKQFRSVAQDYTYLRNLNKERMGLFRMPARFIRRTYLQPATDTSKPMESGTFSLDVSGLASCYRTAQGVGIHGRSGADTKERRTGIHWAWAVAGVPILIVAFLQFGPKAIAGMFSQKPPAVHAAPAAPAAPAAAPGIPPAEPARTAVPHTLPAVVSGGVSPEAFTPAPVVTMTGFAWVGPDRYMVFLSDGRSYRTGDGHLQVLADEWCLVDGRRYEFRDPSLYEGRRGAATAARPPL